MNELMHDSHRDGGGFDDIADNSGRPGAVILQFSASINRRHPVNVGVDADAEAARDGSPRRRRQSVTVGVEFAKLTLEYRWPRAADSHSETCRETRQSGS